MSYVKSLGADAPAAKPAASANAAVRDLVDSEAVRTAAGAALVYHGYKRTGSVLWALLYGLAGRQAPVIATTIAVAQGYGVRKGCP